MSKSPADEFKAKQAAAAAAKKPEPAKKDPAPVTATVSKGDPAVWELLSYLHAALPATTSDGHVLFGLGGKKFTAGDLRRLLRPA